MSSNNVTSSASLTTRASVWFRSIPLITRSIFAICVGIYVLELLFGTINGTVCLLPLLTVERRQVYRLVTPVWFHGGLLHIVLNMLAFLPMGTQIERTLVGSLNFAYLTLLFDLLCGLVHTMMATILFYNPIFQYPSFYLQCNIGFSSILFALLTLNVYQNPNSTRSLFGFVTVPGKFYPWILLIVLQLLMPGISFLGHLSGILVGVMYVFGYLNLFLLSPSTLNKLESRMGWLVMRDGYIANPNLGGSLPTVFGNNDSQPGLLDRLSSMVPRAPSPSTPNQPFSGTGYTLSGQPPPNQP